MKIHFYLDKSTSSSLLRILGIAGVLVGCNLIEPRACVAQGDNGSDKRSPESVAASLERLSGGLFGSDGKDTEHFPPGSMDGDQLDEVSAAVETPGREPANSEAIITPDASIHERNLAPGEIKEALILDSNLPADSISPPGPATDFNSAAAEAAADARADVAVELAAAAAAQAVADADTNQANVQQGVARIDPLVEQLAISTKFDKARAAANRGDFTQARKIWEILAELDHADSEFSLGRMYARGDGVKKDFAKARAYFERAAAHNHGRALYSLGVMARNGDGQLINQEKALAYFERAVAAGYDDARAAIRELKRK